MTAIASTLSCSLLLIAFMLLVCLTAAHLKRQLLKKE